MNSSNAPRLKIIILCATLLLAAFFGSKYWLAHASAEREKLSNQLIAAVKSGDSKAIKSLLDKGADARAADTTGATALMWAAGHGRTECMHLLISHGATVNAKDKHGATALIESVASGKIAGVRLLLNNGADSKHKDSDGKTAFAWATDLGETDIVQLLNSKTPKTSVSKIRPRSAPFVVQDSKLETPRVTHKNKPRKHRLAQLVQTPPPIVDTDPEVARPSPLETVQQTQIVKRKVHAKHHPKKIVAHSKPKPISGPVWAEATPPVSATAR